MSNRAQGVFKDLGPSGRMLLVEGSDFRERPVGGQLTMARLLVRLFPQRFALVGMGTYLDPVGSWSIVRVGSVDCPFFSVAKLPVADRRPFIPARAQFYAGLQRWRRSLEPTAPQFFTQSPEALIAMERWGLGEGIFQFAGVGPTLGVSRYPWLLRLGPAFERRLLEALQGVHLILASADHDAVRDLCYRSRGLLSEERVTILPTTYDDEVFFPGDKLAAREELGLDGQARVLVCVGRLNRAKGWVDLLKVMRRIVATEPNAILVFVGDGEDRSLLASQVVDAGLGRIVRVTGFVGPRCVATYLRAADVFVSASYQEGWSVAMLEALACGVPAVVTRVSGATTLVRHGMNGFIVENRDLDAFANRVMEALRLEQPNVTSLRAAKLHAPDVLRDRLSLLWPALRE